MSKTVANFYLAFDHGLDLVPVLNKVDLPQADPERIVSQMESAFDVDVQSVLRVSAKTGLGLDQVLPAVVERIRPPSGSPSAPLRMLLFDAYHDTYRGAVCLVAVVDGELQQGDSLVAASTGAEHQALEVGVLAPEPHPTGSLHTGQVGYVICGLKDVKAVRVGDTWHHARVPVDAMPGFKPAKALVFAGLYPASGDEFEALAAALERLTLNDASVSMRRETSDALGAGFRCGFLGVLHLEVFMQRLEQEHGATVIMTAPMVPYRIMLSGGVERELDCAGDYPRNQKVHAVYEPTVTATIVTPGEYLGAVMQLCSSRRGEQLECSYLSSGGSSMAPSSSSSGSGGATGTGASSASTGLDAAGNVASSTAGVGDRSVLRYTLPLSELAGDFYSRLKSATRGYASFDYEEAEYRVADLVRLDVLVNGMLVDALARMVHKSDAERAGRALCAKLAELLDRQQFEITIQAAANGRILARETLKALRKNVLAKCYGGDVTRKRKLLEKQKAGKVRMRQLGAVSVPVDLFPELMKAGR